MLLSGNEIRVTAIVIPSICTYHNVYNDVVIIIILYFFSFFPYSPNFIHFPHFGCFSLLVFSPLISLFSILMTFPSFPLCAPPLHSFPLSLSSSSSPSSSAFPLCSLYCPSPSILLPFPPFLSLLPSYSAPSPLHSPSRLFIYYSLSLLHLSTLILFSIPHTSFILFSLPHFLSFTYALFPLIPAIPSLSLLYASPLSPFFLSPFPILRISLHYLHVLSSPPPTLSLLSIFFSLSSLHFL